MPNHLHQFFGFGPTLALADLLRIVKGDSSQWINEQQFTPVEFRWQEGYGAFSYSRSHVKGVTDYVFNQERHHKKKTFLEEYHQMLKKFEVEFDERCIFKEAA